MPDISMTERQMRWHRAWFGFSMFFAGWCTVGVIEAIGKPERQIGFWICAVCLVGQVWAAVVHCRLHNKLLKFDQPRQESLL